MTWETLDLHLKRFLTPSQAINDVFPKIRLEICLLRPPWLRDCVTAPTIIALHQVRGRASRERPRNRGKKSNVKRFLLAGVSSFGEQALGAPEVRYWGVDPPIKNRQDWARSIERVLLN